MGNITIQGDLTGDVPGGEVGGASNLTTVGAIPYVSAAGALNQDPTALFWDAANNRLGVGTGSPQAGLWAAGGAGFVNYSGTLNLFLIANPSSQSNINFQDGTSGFGTNRGSIVYYSSSNSTSPNLMSIASSGPISFSASASERARFAATTGNLLIGTSTDSNFKLDVAASGSAGTMRVYDATATTGTTRMVVQAGAGQSGNLQEWQAANGTAVSGISTAGLSLGTTAFPALLVVSSSSGQMLYADNNSVSLNSPGTLGWTATVNATSSKDLSLSRASAGVLRVGDGGSNANGTVSLTRSQHAGVLVAALPAAAAGNAGSIQYVTDANATTIGSTVAGGGANKVMVWSDGAAWKIFAS